MSARQEKWRKRSQGVRFTVGVMNTHGEHTEVCGGGSRFLLKTKATERVGVSREEVSLVRSSPKVHTPGICSHDFLGLVLHET